MKSAILLELNDILILTKVELETEASAFPLQALVGLKDMIKFRLWRSGRPSNPKRADTMGRRTTPDFFKFQIVFSWKMFRITRAHSTLRRHLGIRTQTY